MKTITNLFKAAIATSLLPIDFTRDIFGALVGDRDGNVEKRIRQIEIAVDKAIEPLEK